MKKVNVKKLIGRSEKLDFPDLGLYGIDAKIDTGAYTSVLHCHDIHIKVSGNETILCFKLLDPTHPEFQEKEQQFSVYSTKEIKNSFGDLEKRFVIKTRVKLAGRIVNTMISLTDRGNMRYPVLMGRKFLRNRFIVDVSELNLGKN